MIGYRVLVEAQPGGAHDSPRMFDGNLGVMVTNAKRQSLPFEGDLAAEIDRRLRDHGLRRTTSWLKRQHGAKVVLPVRAYSHGDFRLSTADGYPFDDPWDSGLVGVIFDTPQTREARGLAEDYPAEKIAEILAEEVKLYDTWANDEILGYVIESREDADSPWDVIEAGGGYYSEAEALQAAAECGLDIAGAVKIA